MNNRPTITKRNLFAAAISTIGVIATLGSVGNALAKNLGVRLDRPNSSTWKDCSTGATIVAKGRGYEGSTIRCEETTAGSSVVDACTGNPTKHTASVQQNGTSYPSQSYIPASGIQTTWTDEMYAGKLVFAYVEGNSSTCFSEPLRFDALTQGAN